MNFLIRISKTAGSSLAFTSGEGAPKLLCLGSGSSYIFPMTPRSSKPSSKKSPKKKSSTDAKTPFFIYNRIMVFSGDHCALGPGRVEIMEQIGKSRSLNQAAKDMGMSYMKAWMLARSLNKSFRKPVIELARGGKKGGGARLTAAGEEVLSLYRRMQTAADKAVRSASRTLHNHLPHC